MLDGDEQSIGDMKLSDFQVQEVRAIFNTIDMDGDGVITMEEAKNLPPSAEQGISEDLL